MDATAYKTLIASDLGLGTSSELLALVESHWTRFSDREPLDFVYLLAKRAVVRSLIGRSRKLIDTIIGGDTIKASQVVSNLKILLESLNDEIAEDYGTLSIPDMESSEPNPILTSGYVAYEDQVCLTKTC